MNKRKEQYILINKNTIFIKVFMSNCKYKYQKYSKYHFANDSNKDLILFNTLK